MYKCLCIRWGTASFRRAFSTKETPSSVVLEWTNAMKQVQLESEQNAEEAKSRILNRENQFQNTNSNLENFEKPVLKWHTGRAIAPKSKDRDGSDLSFYVDHPVGVLCILDALGGWHNMFSRGSSLSFTMALLQNLEKLLESIPKRWIEAEKKLLSSPLQQAVHRSTTRRLKAPDPNDPAVLIPYDLLQESHDKVVDMRDEVPRGACCALLAVLDGRESKRALYVATIGHPSLAIVRKSACVFRSKETYHEFPDPMYLGAVGDGVGADSAVVGVAGVEVGDIVVAGSDGLFAVLDDNEIAVLVSEGLAMHKTPKEIARRIAKTVHEKRHTDKAIPFSTKAETLGGSKFLGRYVDDATVLVSQIS